MRLQHNFLLFFLLVLTTLFAAAQTGTPRSIGQRPGMGQPGLGNPPGIPQDAGPMGTDQTMGQPQPEPVVDDATLERQVHEQLAGKSEFASVSATVNNGVVRLEGSVPSKEDRKQAKRLVKSIAGVRGVKEKLTVSAASGAGGTSSVGAASQSSAPESTATPQTPATGNPSPQSNSGAVGAPSGTAGAEATGGASNAQTGAGALGQTQSNPNSTSGTLKPSTEPLSSSAGSQPPSGTATTSGGVAGTAGATGENVQTQTSGQANAVGAGPQQGTAGTSGAATEGGAAPGAVSSTTTTADVAMLHGQLQTALEREPALANDNIIINITQSTIELSGTVNTGKEKQTARRIAQSYAGNRRVIDRLTVTGRGHGANVDKSTPGE